MAWTTPTTVNPGDAILSSLWNEQVRDNLTELAPFFAGWTTYTPTLSNWTIGNGTAEGKYLRVGDYVFAQVSVVWGSTTSASSGATLFGLPLEADSTNYTGSGRVEENGVRSYTATSFIYTTTACRVAHSESGTNGWVSNISPFTFGAGDSVIFSIFYRVA